MKYLNMKGNYGIETVDELNPADFKTRREFWKELRRLAQCYRENGMPVYISQRPDKTWNN